MKRTYGSGSLHVKSGAFYIRWRTPDGRHHNRRVGVELMAERDCTGRGQPSDDLNAAGRRSHAGRVPLVCELLQPIR